MRVEVTVMTPSPAGKPWTGMLPFTMVTSDPVSIVDLPGTSYLHLSIVALNGSL